MGGLTTLEEMHGPKTMSDSGMKLIIVLGQKAESYEFPFLLHFASAFESDVQHCFEVEVAQHHFALPKP